MKKITIDHPLVLGIILLVSMSFAGVASGLLAYQLGYASLKGVSQPDINPSKKFTGSRAGLGRNQGFIPVDEGETIKKVKIYIQKQKNGAKPGKTSQETGTRDERGNSPPPGERG